MKISNDKQVEKAAKQISDLLVAIIEYKAGRIPEEEASPVKKTHIDQVNEKRAKEAAQYGFKLPQENADA